jgi:CBS domain-containing protein
MKPESRQKPDTQRLVVKDVVRGHRGRHLPIIKRDLPVSELTEKIEWFRHSRQLYVVDENEYLLGNITIASLVRHLFIHHHGSSINPRHLLSAMTAETAEDLMYDRPLSVGMDERVDDVLEKMVAKNIEEVPVLDKAGKVIADVTMIDLMKIYKSST